MGRLWRLTLSLLQILGVGEVEDLAQMTLTLRASSPFRPAAISNSTC